MVTDKDRLGGGSGSDRPNANDSAQDVVAAGPAYDRARVDRIDKGQRLRVGGTILRPWPPRVADRPCPFFADTA